MPARYGQQRVRQILAERLPSLSPDALEQIARGFEEHLTRTSRLQSENYAQGRMDDSELISRMSVFLHDNPGLLGRSAGVGNVEARIQSAIATRQGTALAPTERSALAERFLRALADQSRLAHQNLLAGRMTDEELASRVTVFLEDLRTEAAATTAPDVAGAAAAELVADQFVRHNFGPENERATTLVYDCRIEGADSGPTQSIRIIRKAPAKIRLHLLTGDLVSLVLATDGTSSWVQHPARPSEPLTGAAATNLAETAPFDHPLIGYKARGARLSLAGGGTEPFELTLTEADGRTVVATIDPLTYEESREITRTPSGRTSELRLRDYRRIGTANIPCTQELWRDGHLVRTTRLENLSTEATLLDELFAPPANELVGFMDYMGGLALLQARAATATDAPAAPSAPTAALR